MPPRWYRLVDGQRTVSASSDPLDGDAFRLLFFCAAVQKPWSRLDASASEMAQDIQSPAVDADLPGRRMRMTDGEAEPSSGGGDRLRFEGFEVDMRSGELLRDGELVHLRRQPFKVLALLAQRPGVLVTRDHIRAALWGQGTTVDFETGLNRCIRELRAALGDDARAPRFIETLSKRGYRFIARVEATPPGGTEAQGSLGSPPPAGPRPVALRPLWIVALAALLAPLLFGYSGRGAPSGRVLLAVLPFEDLSGEPGASYFSDGLTEELSVQIGRLAPSRLGVIARGSTSKFRQMPRAIDAVCRELGVRYVVEGSVRRDGERVRVSIKLIDGADRSQVWAEVHESDLREVLHLQDRLAHGVAQRVGLTLAMQGPGGDVVTERVDADAYETYLRGLQRYNARTDDDLHGAVEDFSHAASRQPRLAIAHAMLAQAQFLRVDRGLIPRSEGSERVRQEAELALGIDPTLAQAYVALAAYRVLDSWDWTGAELLYRDAIRHDANYATAHQWYANLLVNQGRCGEALAEIRHALELDPLSLIVNQATSSIHLICGRRAEASAHADRILVLDPRWPGGHISRARVLLRSGRFPQALAALDRYAASGGRGPSLLAWQAYFNAVAGRPDVARHLRDELVTMAATQSHSTAYELAVAQAAAGAPDEAFRAMDKAIIDRHPGLRYVGHDERVDSLRADPRFEGVLRRVGLGHSARAARE